MASLLELALTYTKAGISIIPVAPDGANALDANLPFDCSEYLWRRIATAEELRQWFTEGNQFGLAAVLGPISGGLECLDLTNAAVAKLFRELVTLQRGTDLLEKLPALRETIQGRTRLYYRCPKPISGRRRLALFECPSEPEATLLQLLAGVLGEDSWTVLPGSPVAYGDSNGVFEWINRDLTEVPTLAEDERELLLESAGCMNAWIDPATISGPPTPDGFDNRMTWEQILLPLRWRKVKDSGEVSLWQSPERTKRGYCAVSGLGLNRDLLYLLGTEEAYTKFGAFVSFYFDGNFEKARSVRPRLSHPSRWDTPRASRYSNGARNLLPLVSCIMPTTAGRGRFLRQAIKCFQRQTYANLELVIVCDGEDDLFRLIPSDDERVHYFYLGRERCTIGTKRNLACERTKGDLIAHCDDDDWSHPDRLSFQVGALLAEGAEICGISQLLFFEIESGVVWLCRIPALLHPSLYPALSFGAVYLYRRSYWSSSPFPDVPRDSDIAFTSAEGRQDHCVLVPDCRLYVAMIHHSNTTDYSEKSSYWTPWSGDLREIMGNDLDFYLSLRESGQQCSSLTNSTAQRRSPGSENSVTVKLGSQVRTRKTNR